MVFHGEVDAQSAVCYQEISKNVSLFFVVKVYNVKMYGIITEYKIKNHYEWGTK